MNLVSLLKFDAQEEVDPVELLRDLPGEPGHAQGPWGLSLEELAEDLLESRGPSAKAKVRRALGRIEKALGDGGLVAEQGQDDFGRVELLYGISRRVMPAVRAALANRLPESTKLPTTD